MIIKRDGQWYFLNETWSAKIGPYKTRDEARIEFKKYINNWNKVNSLLSSAPSFAELT